MKRFVFLLACGLLELAAADELPEFRTVEGKLYKQVKVVKSSPAEIRIMHAEGFATIPLSSLPPEILARFGGKVNKMAEDFAVTKRKLDSSTGYTASVPSVQPTTQPAPLAAEQAAPRMRLDEFISTAISNRRMLVISYDNGAEGLRVVEPHLLGVTTAGRWGMLAWFRAGATKSGQGEGWRVYDLTKLTSIEMSPQVFNGPRDGFKADGGGLFTSVVARLPEAQPAIAAAQAAPVILMQDFIDGEFTGFEAGKKFKLMSGQVLQQMDGTYLYHYSYGPKITIYQTEQGSLMKVQGVEQPVLVMPVQ